MKKGIVALLLLFLLAGCGQEIHAETYQPLKDNSALTTGSTEPAEETPYAPVKTFNENIPHTSQGTPILDRFDTSGMTTQETPDSTAFSEIGYDADREILMVTFRSSGSYIYYDVPPEKWEELRDADSPGGYYNREIKGQYDCFKLS